MKLICLLGGGSEWLLYFLIKEYYPKHSSFKSRLAKLYVDQLINNESFECKINIVKQRLEDYTNKFYGIEN